MLYQIYLKYACYGIIVKNNIVIEAPPIAKWMEGKNVFFIQRWIDKKRGKMKLVEEK